MTIPHVSHKDVQAHIKAQRDFQQELADGESREVALCDINSEEFIARCKEDPKFAIQQQEKVLSILEA
jgi:hypothetical protein